MTTYQTAAGGIQDRTLEFQQCVSTFSRQQKGQKYAPVNSQAQLQQQSQISSSEFSREASKIAKQIAGVTGKLHRLAKLATQKQLFSERPTDLIELTYVIKQEIFTIENSIKELQKSIILKKANEPQVETFNKNVVQLLNTKTKNISEKFKDVLEVRQRNEIAQRTRQEQMFIDTANRMKSNGNEPEKQAPYALRNKPVTSDNPFMVSLTTGSDSNDPDVSIPGDGDYLSIPDQSQQLLLLEEQNNQYLQERNRAVEAIESTIQEVGGLFQQLATMVQEQGEVIQRIDNNVEDISLNITGAQRELLKFYNHVSSNRWLMVKIFGVLILFFLLWVLIS